MNRHYMFSCFIRNANFGGACDRKEKFYQRWVYDSGAAAAELVEELSNASKKGRLQESMLTFTHPHVLVVDEVGYLTYGPDAANVLFHVVNDRHLRKRPMIFTTNKPLSEWGKVLHDEDLAAAILDRVLERGRFIHLDGPSGRTRHLNLDQALPSNAERLRISGTRNGRTRYPLSRTQGLSFGS
jgi:hypothetical protein